MLWENRVYSNYFQEYSVKLLGLKGKKIIKGLSPPSGNILAPITPLQLIVLKGLWTIPCFISISQMRAGKILKTVKHLTMGRICSRQASVLTVLFHKCLLCRRNFWKMGMGGKYASLKGAFGSFCMKKVNAELIRIGSRQRKAEGWGETGDRDGGRERDRACPNAGSCVPAAERQAHCIPLIALTTSYSKRWHFSILN